MGLPLVVHISGQRSGHITTFKWFSNQIWIFKGSRVHGDRGSLDFMTILVTFKKAKVSKREKLWRKADATIGVVSIQSGESYINHWIKVFIV